MQVADEEPRIIREHVIRKREVTRTLTGPPHIDEELPVRRPDRYPRQGGFHDVDSLALPVDPDQPDDVELGVSYQGVPELVLQLRGPCGAGSVGGRRFRVGTCGGERERQECDPASEHGLHTIRRRECERLGFRHYRSSADVEEGAVPGNR